MLPDDLLERDVTSTPSRSPSTRTCAASRARRAAADLPARARLRPPDGPARPAPFSASAWSTSTTGSSRTGRCPRRGADADRRGSQLRPHRRGRQFDFVTEASVGDELVWEDVSTNLKRGDGDDRVRDACGARGAAGHRRLAAAATTSAAATPPSPATTTRSTCTAWPLRRSASRARSRTACGRRPAAWPRSACPTRSTVDVRFKKPVLLPRR